MKTLAILSLACLAGSLLPNGAFAQTQKDAKPTVNVPQTVEYATGRRGLAMSGGYFRGVPLGELSGWSASLWFQAGSQEPGDIFGIVLDRKSDRIVRLKLENDQLQLIVPTRSPAEKKKFPNGHLIEAPINDPDRWHQAVITYSQDVGPSLYLDGERVGSGDRRWLGYGVSFSNYHFGARALANGNYANYFDGLIDDFALRSRALTAAEVSALFEDLPVDATLAAFNDFENVSHRDLARFGGIDEPEAYLEQGRKLYELNCIACHSKDEVSPPPNPLARYFTKQEMANGGDPHSLFETLTYGFRNMMAAPQLNPEERYKVIHYIREKLIHEKAPNLYVELPDTYTDSMPTKPEGIDKEAERIEALAKTGYLRDYGNALITPVDSENPANRSRNGLVINLGNETTIGYDLGTMNAIGAWQGGYLDFSNTLHHKLRASGLPTARFDFLPGMENWRWAWDGKAENTLPKRKPLTIYPEEQIRYRGHYPSGEETLISYTVQGRGVLESPLAETIGQVTIIHHRLTIEPGKNAIELVVGNSADDVPRIDKTRATVGNLDVWLNSNSKKTRWRTSEKGELTLHIPASHKAFHFDIALAPTKKYRVATIKPNAEIVDLRKRTRGGPRRWTETHTLKGKLATDTFQGYALDSIPVPLKNVYNSWMRTSSLAFFPDGRLAVSTLNGDIWIVSGVDNKLEEVTWQRFAAGVYEPLGMKVVDGVLTAGTRGRIVKFHDYDNDGEADFYEAFHNEAEPANGWHAYSFDLVMDDSGNFYYARVGQYSDWSVPGGLVRVSSDGKTSTLLSSGMRVPNGLGILPDGRITYSDNQGTYVPASKISIADTPNSFHGAGGWEKREGNYDPNEIVDPIVYMPQELDSSSSSQLWMPKDSRFGPLAGQYFHASYGQSKSMMIFTDELEDTTQGAVFALPMKMESGTMRLAKSPTDGQLYYSGLTGWQSGATREGSIQRLRYTGNDGLYLIDAKARKGRLLLTFNRPIDATVLKQTNDWQAAMWNYKWSPAYGSPKYKVTEPEVEGIEALSLAGGELDSSGTHLTLNVPDLQPCHNLKLDFSVKGSDGHALEGPVYFTIHKLVEDES